MSETANLIYQFEVSLQKLGCVTPTYKRILKDCRFYTHQRLQNIKYYDVFQKTIPILI